MKKTILLLGGAGYIGSHTAYLLHKKNYRIIILDMFYHQQVIHAPWATIIQENYGNTKVLHTLFKKYKIDTIIHFASFIEIGLSVNDPIRFYHNNVANTIILLSIMQQYAIKKIIFSSSAAVYGIPQTTPIPEHHPKNPINPYGMSKLMIENILHDTHKARTISYVALRYFNAAGALPSQGLGEQHTNETHIIPLLLHAAINDKPFHIFGTDYPTPDGTALRDYIHVLDIAQAHIAALEYLENNNPSDCFNLGTEIGISVQSMVHHIEKITNKPIRIINKPRRAGDPAILIADSQKARTILQWQPKYSDIDTITNSAYEFESQKFCLTTSNYTTHETESQGTDKETA